jgi:hypothetical protein
LALACSYEETRSCLPARNGEPGSRVVGLCLSPIGTTSPSKLRRAVTARCAADRDGNRHEEQPSTTGPGGLEKVRETPWRQPARPSSSSCGWQGLTKDTPALRFALLFRPAPLALARSKSNSSVAPSRRRSPVCVDDLASGTRPAGGRVGDTWLTGRE